VETLYKPRRLRTAVLTDIHANLPALSAVLAECDRLLVDRFVCLGDTVGYGAEPNECCALVRERVSFSLLGNHDAAASGRMRYEDYYDAAREALDWTRQRLTKANLGWLASLPYSAREGAVGYCHGSPIEPEQYEYVFLLEHARELLPVVEDLPHVTLIGHSHLPRAYALGRQRARSVLADEIDLRGPEKFLISIGSVGQPRDGDPRACFAVYDDATQLLRFHRVSYDMKTSASRIRAAGLSDHFAQRLFTGV
jgi:diadenosine tetraphosphatase ApaH/serine/threonine PP2A family protein phosphatase